VHATVLNTANTAQATTANARVDRPDAIPNAMWPTYAALALSYQIQPWEAFGVRKPIAAAGSAVFFVVAPGTIAGLIPWWLTGWHSRPSPDGWAAPFVALRVVGLALVLAGAGFVVTAFVRFVIEGLGTPAPIAPPSRLVVGGIYRYLRNPMYVALIACILGQALLLNQPVLLWYAAIAGAAMVAFARLYEEPTLTRQFGADYERYRAAVPGWWPRLRPWQPPQP
jgi:protein-S-isoprenylcysteine O-methyltransferase Ste14